MRPTFINVGERTNVTGPARFNKLVIEGDDPAALTVARQPVEAGARIIDSSRWEVILERPVAMPLSGLETFERVA